MKNAIKLNLGVGIVYDFLDETGLWFSDVKPSYNIGDYLTENSCAVTKDGHFAARPHLLSWAKYTKKQRKDTIDALINEMILSGVQTKKFNKIMEGIKH